jgi:A/G-specific adenine glycosylase
VAKRAKPKASTLWLVAFEAGGHVLLYAPAAKGLLAGLWRWPTVDATDLPLQAPADGTRSVLAWPGWTQVYTHRREAVSPLWMSLESRFTPTDGTSWVPLADLRGLPMGRRDQRLRDLLGTPGQVPVEAPIPAALIKAHSSPAS